MLQTADGKGAELFEFNYMIMQSYDFLLSARSIRLQHAVRRRRPVEQYAGGNGSDPQKDRKKCLCNDDYSADEQRRQKMGKTANGAVWLDPKKRRL